MKSGETCSARGSRRRERFSGGERWRRCRRRSHADHRRGSPGAANVGAEMPTSTVISGAQANRGGALARGDRAAADGGCAGGVESVCGARGHRLARDLRAGEDAPRSWARTELSPLLPPGMTLLYPFSGPGRAPRGEPLRRSAAHRDARARAGGAVAGSGAGGPTGTSISWGRRCPTSIAFRTFVHGRWRRTSSTTARRGERWRRRWRGSGGR